MKFIPIILLFIISCQKPHLVIMDRPVESNLQNRKNLLGDTTINGVWNGYGKVLRVDDYKIHGSGTLMNWIIEAPLSANCFDTTLTITGCRGYNEVWSGAWWGANSSNSDNWWNLQKTINMCLANGLRDLYLPRGNYRYSKPLEILQRNATQYLQSILHFYGDASFWDTGSGTTLTYTSSTDCALNLQLNKGSEIDHLEIRGQWKSPATVDSVYYFTTYDNFKDVSGKNCDEYYYGIAIDWRKPIDNVSQSGSTGINVHDVTVRNFTHLIAVSQNGISRNADILLFENIHLGEGKTGFINGQAQEKAIDINGVYCWDRLHTVVSVGKHGNYQAGDYHINGGNLAGKVIRLADISASGWFATTITDVFCESIGYVGDFSTQIPLVINNCTFDFVLGLKQHVVLNSNSPLVRFENCLFRYYDGGWKTNEIWVHGAMTFVNCGGNIIYK